jgi:hypothetical protein
MRSKSRVPGTGLRPQQEPRIKIITMCLFAAGRLVERALQKGASTLKPTGCKDRSNCIARRKDILQLLSADVTCLLALQSMGITARSAGLLPAPVSQGEQDLCRACVHPNLLQGVQQHWDGIRLQQQLVRACVLLGGQRAQQAPSCDTPHAPTPLTGKFAHAELQENTPPNDVSE